MKNKNIFQKVVLLLIISVISMNKQSFAINQQVIDDLSLFMYNYEFDAGEGLLFEMIEEAKKVNTENIVLSVSDIENEEMLKNLALSYIGKKYKYGAAGPDEFDCSGFVLRFFEKLSIQVPRTSAQQSKFGKFVDKKDLKVGDVLFFDTRNSKNTEDISIDIQDVALFPSQDGTNTRVTHSGIYIGDGKFVHASSGNIMKIVIENLDSKYFATRYLFAQRYL